jgi:pimeloyl-ACP methyl ester carboxylesterase
MGMASFEDIQGRYADIGGTKIYYDELGSGIPMVCAHTAGGCSMQWHEIMPLLARAGFRVIALDLPGHGKSYPVRWTPFTRMREYAEFVWGFVQHVARGEKAVFMGCSIGANMATDLAAHHGAGLRAVVAMEGAARTSPLYDVRRSSEPHAHVCRSYFSEAVTVASCAQPMLEGKDIELQWLHRYAPQQVATSDLQCWMNHDVRDRMKDVACPYLNVRGEADFFLSQEVVDATMADIPDGLGEAVCLERIGHYPMFEQPQLTADVVLDFLRRRGVA